VATGVGPPALASFGEARRSAFGEEAALCEARSPGVQSRDPADGGAKPEVRAMPHRRLRPVRERPDRRAALIVGMAAACVIVLQLSPAAVVAPAGLGAGPAAWTNDLAPISTAEWDHDRAAHLLERGGFAATPEEIDRLAAMTPQRAVDWLVNYDAIDGSRLPRFDESGIWDPGMDPFPESRAEAARRARQHGDALGERVLANDAPRRLQPVIDKFFYGLRANTLETQRLALWWANRMLTTPRPLEEKLTLFWHGHFATGQTKVRDYRMMLRQNELFRRNASGSFRDLVSGLLRDPAMLVYLDNGENVKSHPNENFGRELLELFTMGVGSYGERDIREAARAFTGWTNHVLEFRFDEQQHDFGPKTFLGRTGEFNGDDIIAAILAQPVTAEFVSSKLYRYFVREDIGEPVRRELGRTFRESGYQLKPLLTRVFLSKDFYSAPSYGTQMKSPVHLVVSTFKKMGLTEVPTVPDFGRLTASLGQTLFEPPNVAGWAGGRTWITASTLLQRGNMWRDVLFPDPGSFRAPDRSMPPIYAEVGERLARGMNITQATQGGDAESNMMADRDEDYNTRYGGYMGYVLAFDRVKRIPRRPAEIDLTAMIRASGAKTTEEVVDHLIRRFMRVRPMDTERVVLIDFLRKEIGTGVTAPPEKLEPALRRLLYLVLSTTEYQLG
jgi:uncharacterized protein (DUF1800 family)